MGNRNKKVDPEKKREAKLNVSVHRDLNGTVVKSGFCPMEYCIYEIPSGSKCLMVGGMLLHPPGKDPLESHKEYAEDAAKDALKDGVTAILVIGAELGYFVSYLCDALEDHPEIDIYCYDEYTPTIGLEMDRDRIKHIHAPEDLDVAMAPHIRDEKDHINLIICPHGNEPYRWELNYSINVLDRNLTLDANMPYAMIKSERSVEVLEMMPHMNFVDELFDTMTDRPAILCSGGPSTDPEKVKELLAANPDGVVIAAAQCLKKLNEGGVIPDFTVVADVSDTVAQFALDGEAKGLWAEAMTSPKLFEKYGDTAYYYSVKAAHLHYPLWRDLGLWVMRDTPAMATVTEMMVLIATRLGLRKMVIMGADYANPEFGGVCFLPAMGNGGKRVYTYMHYTHGCRYLDTFVARNPQLDIVRIAPDGLPTPHIPGPENMDPKPRTHREFDPEEWEKFTGNKYTEEPSPAVKDKKRLQKLIRKFAIDILESCAPMCNPKHGEAQLASIPDLSRPVLTPMKKLYGEQRMLEAAKKLRAEDESIVDIWMPGERIDG